MINTNIMEDYYYAQEIIEKITEDGGYIDDHRSNTSDKDKINHAPAYLLYARGNRIYVCPAPETNVGFCLNPLYIDGDDGKVHLSRMSVGGTLRLHGDDSMSGLKMAIYNYNNEESYTKIRDEIIQIIPA